MLGSGSFAAGGIFLACRALSPRSESFFDFTGSDFSMSVQLLASDLRLQLTSDEKQ
jgi:hypothetical protein